MGSSFVVLSFLPMIMMRSFLRFLVHLKIFFEGGLDFGDIDAVENSVMVHYFPEIIILVSYS